MSQLEMLQGQPIRPLRRAEFNQLAELGAFQEERVELLYGQLIPMSPVGRAALHGPRAAQRAVRGQAGADADPHPDADRRIG
ncbi:MAG: hypothetical protein R3B07_21800 [Polyangiaceae bacterium]